MLIWGLGRHARRVRVLRHAHEPVALPCTGEFPLPVIKFLNFDVFDSAVKAALCYQFQLAATATRTKSMVQMITRINPPSGSSVSCTPATATYSQDHARRERVAGSAKIK